MSFHVAKIFGELHLGAHTFEMLTCRANVSCSLRHLSVTHGLKLVLTTRKNSKQPRRTLSPLAAPTIRAGLAVSFREGRGLVRWQ